MRTTATVVAAAVAVWAGAAAAQESAAAQIKSWLAGYDAAFNAKDLSRLAAFYHPDVTIYEGGSINNGWADYRDNHLGPELQDFEGLRFSHSNVTVHLLHQDGRTAYVTSEYRLQARVKDREVDASGLETLILIKDANGGWKVRHSHTSAKRRAPGPSPGPSPSPH